MLALSGGETSSVVVVNGRCLVQEEDGMRVARVAGTAVFPYHRDDKEVYTHGIEALVEALPFRDSLRRSLVWRDFANQVNRWKPSWRYNPRDWEEESARAFLDAVDRVYRWLDSNRC